jgi:hypothetical protein
MDRPDHGDGVALLARQTEILELIAAGARWRRC